MVELGDADDDAMADPDLLVTIAQAVRNSSGAGQ
jgi:hypothetical protein